MCCLVTARLSCLCTWGLSPCSQTKGLLMESPSFSDGLKIMLRKGKIIP